MQPQTAAPQPDLQALALTKAIRQHESGGNYQAVGDNATSTGAYQYQPATWAAFSKQILGVDNAPMTEANQNAVTYGMIKTWKDQGLGPAQIAAKWNSGSETGWENKVGTTTRNGQALQYNVPAYVQSVVNNFKQIYPQVAAQYSQQGPATPPAPQTTPDSALNGFQNIAGSLVGGKQLAEGAGFALSGLGDTYNKLAEQNDQSVTNLINQAHALPVGDPRRDALLHQALSQSQALTSDINSGMGLAPTNKQVIGSAAQIPLTLATMGSLKPAATALDLSTEGGAIAANIEGQTAKPFLQTGLGRLTSNTALGAGIGATSAMADGGSIGQGALTGGALGLGGGLVGEALSAVADKLPTRFVKQAATKLNPDASQYMLDNYSFGSVAKNLEESQARANSFRNIIKQVVTSPEYADVRITGEDMAKAFQETFPNNERDAAQLFGLLKNQVPNDAALVTKLASGEGLTLEEANTLRSRLDEISYKLNTDTPEVKANKTLAATFGNAIRAAVKSEAPETVPFFDRFHNELYVLKTLKKLAASKSPNSILKYKDLIGPLIGIGSIGGIPGAIAGAAIEKAVTQPGVLLSAAKVAQKAAPAIKAAGTVSAKTGALSAGL